MPSYAINQYMDGDDVLCKQLLSLELGGPLETSRLSASVVGYKKSGPPCMASSSAPEARLGTCNNWTEHKEPSLSSRWNRMTCWPECGFSAVEGDMGRLDWTSADSIHDKSAAVSGQTSALAATRSSRYKTELCRTFTERGVCKYGNKCQFAHGPDELRGVNRHPKYKTEPCRTFHSIGFCPYGIRCHFVHNNEDDQAHPRPRPSFSPAQRPLLRQSFSFPSSLQLLEPTVLHSSFLRTPSASPLAPAAATSDLLTLAFPELSDHGGDHDGESLVQFLPSPDSGCSLGELTPAPSPSQVAPGPLEACSGRSPECGASLGPRSQSLASLSDQEGGCGSSSSSLSGCGDVCAYEGPGRRLPIFSQLSVPDDGFCREGSTGLFL